MLKQSWNVTAACFIAATLAGCSGTGRFDRGQYASLASDPFLATDEVVGSSSGHTPGVMTASAAGDKAGMPASVSKSDASCGKDCELDPAARKTAENDSVDFGMSLAAAGDAMASQAANEVTDAGNGFGSWLQEKGNEVVQASAEFGNRSRGLARGVQQADFSVFPAPQDNVTASSSRGTDFQAEESPFADNPFTQQDAFAESAEEPLFQSSAEEQDSWPPANFQFD